MKNFLKKFTSILLVFGLILSLSAGTVYADEDDVQDIPFTVSAGAVTDFTENGYSFTDYDAANNWAQFTNTTDLYTVTVPFGSDDEVLTFSEDRIAYGYDADGNYMYSCSSDTSNGYADNGQSGEITANVYDTDAIVRVQTPYDASWSSDLLYAVQFVSSYTFEVSADGEALTDITESEDAYSYYDYMSGETVQVNVYTVKVPAGTETINLKISDNSLVYNYDGSGNYLAGWADDIYTGVTDYTITIDSNNDGSPDYLQVQSPYDASLNSTLFYAITFEFEEETSETEYPGSDTSSADSEAIASDQETVFKGLIDSFLEMAKGTSNANVISAAALGKAGIADKDTAIANALEAAKSPGGTDLQLDIIILSALGIDATAIESDDPDVLSLMDDSADNNTVNLLEILATTSSAIGGWAESPAYTLLAYASASYGVDSSAANAPSRLIALLNDSYKCSDGGYGWGGTSSPDTTGAVIAALSCYEDYDGVSDMISDAVAALKAMQNSDGGFGYAAGAETNVDSTSLAIIGLSSVGIDPAGSDWTASSGENPVTALLSFANSDNTDLVLPSWTDADYARKDAFWALSAYSGFRNTGRAFNVYTMAVTGNAAYQAPEEESSTEETTSEETESSTAQTEETSVTETTKAAETTKAPETTAPAGSSNAKDDKVKTGDASDYINWTIMACAALALIIVLVIARKRKYNE